MTNEVKRGTPQCFQTECLLQLISFSVCMTGLVTLRGPWQWKEVSMNKQYTDVKRPDSDFSSPVAQFGSVTCKQGKKAHDEVDIFRLCFSLLHLYK